MLERRSFMELKLEWESRIDSWLKVLTQDIYHPLGVITLEGCPVKEQFDVDIAMQMDFQPIEPGTSWGRQWEYIWLRGCIILPDEAVGQRIVMKLETGGETSIYVNGCPFGTRRADWIHEPHHFYCDQILTESGKSGDTFNLMLEAYAGHFYVDGCCGPVIPGTFHEPDPEILRTALGTSTYGIWNEEAYQLMLDVKVLSELMKRIPDSSLRYQMLWDGLKKFTCVVDFEQPVEARQQNYHEARVLLKPLLNCKNGSTTPQFYAFGHAHIDIAWLWPLAETKRKVMRTFAAQIRHMDAYPEYKFLQSQPYLYQMTKELYPTLYEKIKAKIVEGQWIPEGGMWVEADTNITGGESLIRQFVHGKRFFMEEFGVDNRMLWLPDVFGYTGALPQIMKGCGIDYFSTQKIWWNYNGGDTFPYNYFKWQGIDGTQISSFMHVDYNSNSHPTTVIDKWNGRKQRGGYNGFLLPYGYGDGGGGPTRDFIEFVQRENDLEGCPKVRHASPLEFFEEQPAPEDTYVGELYMQCHRGVQTTQAKTKKGNRESEFSLRETEIWGTTAKLLSSFAYPLPDVDALWKKILMAQFHDILPGSSIGRVYQEAEKLYDDVLAVSAMICGQAMDSLCVSCEGTTVYNSLSWDRTACVKLPCSYTGAEMSGRLLPVQKINDSIYTEMTVPSYGCVTIHNAEPCEAETGTNAYLTSGGAVIENRHICILFNQRGEISSVVDKATDEEMIDGIGNEMCMFKSITRLHEAWDIDLTYESCPVELPELAEISVVSTGPLLAVLKIVRRLNQSEMCQYVKLARNESRVDFDTEIDWQETHKLLKVCFPVNVYADEAIHEIQFGYVKRPNHRSRQFDLDRFEVPNQKWTALAEEARGAAVLNDCKYGVNVLSNSINLTLLHAPMAPDPHADRGIQKFTYSFYTWHGTFFDCNVVRQGYELNCPLSLHPGTVERASLLRIDKPNIIIETVKPAEDGSDDYILRLYETKKTYTECNLEIFFPCSNVFKTNMLEQEAVELPFEKKDRVITVPLRMKPFEIKTLRIKK
jgi:alpha-mannosidase